MLSTRRITLASLAVGLAFFAALSSAAQAVTIERVSSPVFYIDDSHGDQYRGMYAGYRVTNNDAVDYSNLWVSLNGFVPGANTTLAMYEDGVTTTGPLPRGASRVVYFYLMAARAKTASESHTVSVYGALPFVAPLATRAFGLTVESTITANANKVLTVSYAPAAPVLGGQLRMTITGETGTIGGDRDFAYTPASRIDWPSNSYELVGTTLLLGNEAPRYDALWLRPTSGADQAYTITYTFRVVCAAEGTQISMLNHIDSGANNKHNDPTLLPVAPVPPPTESPLILSRSPVSLMIEGGATVTHTLDVVNTGTQHVTFDDLYDLLVPGPLGPGGIAMRGTYVPGSTTIDGAPFTDPMLTATKALRWSSSFPLGPSEAMTLTYQMTYPAYDGIYEHRAWGEVSSSELGLTCGTGAPTRIDTTPALDDDAPAIAQIAVGTLDVTDDQVAAAEGVPLDILVGELTANDGAHDPATFALLSTTSDRGGQVTYNPVTGVVTYLAPANQVEDTFHYRVCSVVDETICQSGDVFVTINRKPTQANAAVYDVIGTPVSVFAMTSAFSDPDNDLIGTARVLTATGGTATIVGTQLRFVPLVVGAAGSWVVTYEVCDDGVPAACDGATLLVVHNDPPVLESFIVDEGTGLLLAYNDVETVLFSRILVSFGIVTADTPADGDSDGVGTVLVSATTTGPWTTAVTLPDGTRCSVEPDHDLVVTAGSGVAPNNAPFMSTIIQPDPVACYLRVCEELPANEPGVCTTTVVESLVVECLTTADCELGEVCDPDNHVCVPCWDSAQYPFVDAGCWPQKPICDEEPTTPVCVECQDTAPGNALDVGCTPTQPVCDETAVGGPDCVECTTNSDCLDGEVCDPATHTCIGCRDTAPPGGVDEGCEAIINACEGAGEAAYCVDCQSDPDCAVGDVCEVPVRTCRDCLQTADPDDVDPGCDAALPECILDGERNHCVECTDDSDCLAIEICDLSTYTCILRDVIDARDDLYVTPVATPLTVTTRAAGVLGNDIIPQGADPTATVVSATNPNPATQGTFLLAADGTFTFVPFATYVGTLAIDYDVSTQAGGLDRATVRIIVNGAPVAGDDSATTPEDTARVVRVTANDTDPNVENGGQPLAIARVVTAPTHGVATVQAPSDIRYVPDKDWNGIDTLVYEVCDPHRACDTATLTITVTPVNDLPTGGDDSATTPEDTAVLVAVLLNDRDLEGDTLRVARILQRPMNGQVEIVSATTGTLMYTPSDEFNGADTFSYELCDAGQACVEVDVLVLVTPVNDAPRAADDTGVTPRGLATELAVLDNDVDPDGDRLTLTRVIVAPTDGLAQVTSAGTIWYQPAPGFFGEDRLVYEVCDPSGACDSAVATLFVGGSNLAPEAQDDQATTPEGAAVDLDVLFNDLDPEGAELTIADVTPPLSGAVTVADDLITYHPRGGFAGLDRFAYTVCDPLGACDVAAVLVTVTPGPNQPPVAVDDYVTTTVNTAVTAYPTHNDLDPDGDTPLIARVGLPAHGTVATLGDAVTYTPNTGYLGTDSFEVTIADGLGGSDSARVFVLVLPAANRPPVARDDAYPVTAGATFTLAVLGNDSDPDGDPLVLFEVRQPMTGVVTLEGDALRFVSAPGSTGADALTYTIIDRKGGEATATVTLTYPAPGVPPVAHDDWTSTHEDEAVLVVVRANDLDPKGTPIDVTRVLVTPRHGAATLASDDTILYEPDVDFVGTDTFTYELCDGDMTCVSAVVTVVVMAEDEAPRLADDIATTLPNTAVLIPVLVNDADPEGLPLTLARVSTQPVHGTAGVAVNGRVSYRPNPGFIGMDLLRYEACDPAGLCSEALVTVYVGVDNRAPLLVDDVATTPEGVPVDVEVLRNDLDPDGDVLALVASTEPLHGTAYLDGLVLQYVPDRDFVGVERFGYTACDDATPPACASAYVQVTVTAAPNLPPLVTDDLAATLSAVPVSIEVLANDLDPDGDPLSVWDLGLPTHGSAIALGDGTVVYTSTTGFVGTDTFIVTVSDDRGGLATSVVSVLVTAVPNRAPDAVDDAYAAQPGVALVTPVLANDLDADADKLAIVFVFQPTQGKVSFDAQGRLVYTSNASASGRDAFRYTVTDGRGGYDTAEVVLTFPTENRAPVAVDDFGMSYEDGSTLIMLLGNDFDPDGDPLDVVAITEPLYGTAELLSDDSLIYSPQPDYTGLDTLLYRACDTHGLCSTAHVVLRVHPVNDPPVANDDMVATNRDTTVLIGVLGNDGDVDGDPIRLDRITVAPRNGTATFDGFGVVTYTPVAGFVGEDSFVYEICDLAGTCDRAWVTIDIGGINRAPVALDDEATAIAGEPAEVPVLDNDTDPDGDELHVLDVAPSPDAMVMVVDDVVVITPYLDTEGAVTLVYTVCDPAGLCDFAAIELAVEEAVHSPPIAVDDVVTTVRDTPIEIDVLFNDVEPDGDALTISALALPPHGVATVEPDQAVRYVPEQGYVGTVSFDYTIDDGRGGVATATITVRVTATPNRPPEPKDDTYLVTGEGQVVMDALANDSDPDGDALRYIGLIEATTGRVELRADGKLVFTPTPGATGDESFRYNVTDGFGHYVHAYIHLKRPTANLPPNGSDDTLSTDEDRTLIADLLVNDVDPDGDALELRRLVRLPAHGTASLAGGGLARYSPAPSWYGRDTFSYLVCDPASACGVIEVLVEVRPIADPPVARDDFATTNLGKPVVVDVLANDSDADAEPLTLTRVVIAAVHGSTSFTPAGLVTYTPAAGFEGDDFLVYEVCDPEDACATATLRVEVGGANDAPLAKADQASTPEGVAVSVDVLGNDNDPNGDSLTIVEIGQAAHGAVAIVQNHLHYHPEVDFAGVDTTWYRACDPSGACASARVTITVEPGPNRAPLAIDDVATTPFDTPLVVDVTLNDVDPDGDVVSLLTVTDPAHGRVVIDGLGRVLYTPDAGYSGRDELMVEVSDGQGGKASSTLFIIVLPATNQWPIASNDRFVISEDGAQPLDVLANDRDPDGDELVILAVVQPASGSVELGEGVLVFTPAIGTRGLDQLRYLVSDGRGGTDEAVVTLAYPTPNLPPQVLGEKVTTAEDHAVLIRVLANDEDPEGGELRVQGVTDPPRGTASLRADGTVLYTPDRNHVGSDGFFYVVCDAEDACVQAAVEITVTPENDPPCAWDDHATTLPGIAVVIDVLENDCEPDRDALTVARIDFAPQHGTAEILEDGTVRYTPEPGYEDATDSFVYEVCGASGLCDEGMVTVYVGTDNTMPVALDDTAEVDGGELIVIDVLANDTDADGDELVIVNIVHPGVGSKGLATTNGATISYAAEPGQSGVDRFAYDVCDPSGACSTARVTVTIRSGVNQPPVALDDVASTESGEPVSIPVLVNDRDPEGGALRVASFEPPKNGSAVVDAAGVLTYTPDEEFSGIEDFELTVIDEGGATDISNVKVYVSHKNRAPVALDDEYTLTQAAMILDVLANDSDPDGDKLAIVAVTQPTEGEVDFSGGTVVFLAKGGLDQTYRFDYVVSDRKGGLDTGTVTIAPPPDNLPPLGVDDYASVPEDGAVLIDLLVNDSDPEGGALTITGLERQPGMGTVTLLEDGSALYVPLPDRNGVDHFGYELCDVAESCVLVLVRVEVTPVDDPPRAEDDAYAVVAGEATGLLVLANDVDPEGLALTLTLVTEPAHGTAQVGSGGEGGLVYTATEGYVGDDVLTYRACDPGALCDEAQVTLVVGSGNGTPTALPDSAETDAGELVAIDALVNDSDPDGDTLTLAAIGEAMHGVAEIDEDAAELRYTPDRGFTGVDTFWYAACDPHGACASALVTVTVDPGEHPPVAVDDVATTKAGIAVAITVLANDTDPDGDVLRVVVVEHPEHGEATVDGEGVLTYAPNLGFTGREAFVITIEDEVGFRSDSTCVVHVLPADNHPPVALDDFYDVPEATRTELDVMANDSDPDGDALTVVVAVQAKHGAVRFAGGALAYTPDAGYIGRDRFTYVATDPFGARDEALVEVRVGDRDEDTLSDNEEVNVIGTDPDDPDTDGDGLRDNVEIAAVNPKVYDAGTDTNPLDADTDDDGLGDGEEVLGIGHLDGRDPTDVLDFDSDDDGLGDGQELGLTAGVPAGVSDGNQVAFAGSDPAVFHPDLDPATTTEPLDGDSDDDGLLDGNEDADHNGRWDGTVGATGTPGAGETDATLADTDGDGIQDGTELGLVTPQGPDTDATVFQPDLDPSTTTDPRDLDTDDGSVFDGAEDVNSNGRIDEGEIDPNYWFDDVPKVVTGGPSTCSGAGDGPGSGIVFLVLLLSVGFWLAERRRAKMHR